MFDCRGSLYSFLAVVLCSAGVVSAEYVTLKSGVVITAPVLKDDGESVILDLGHDVLRVPRGQVLSVRSEDTPEAPSVADSGTHLYGVSDSERLTTTEASRRCAPAIVVVKTPGGLGSGFFVNTNGYLLTNFHVIKGQKHISVTRFSREPDRLKRVVHEDVEIVAVAPFHDLAVLRVTDLDADLTPVSFAAHDRISVGEPVFAIGNPMGLERTVTKGVISQEERNFKGILYRQIDAPVNPGNSGGPLFNDRGQVVGIINMGVPAMEGLNFAIPSFHAKYILDHIDAFAYDETNSESGYVYPAPPSRPTPVAGDGVESPGGDPKGNNEKN